MLFNSYEFIFLFLPLALLGYYKVAQTGRENAILWLVLASLFFYSWWNPYYLVLILVSLLINFWFGKMLVRAHQAGDGSKGILWLSVGIGINLGLLGYFKYANFFVDNVNFLFGTDMYLSEIILPLAISFFTFQQITYLVDAYKGITKEYIFFHYALFVTFFPQLIAGPIVHHREMLPQFMQKDALKPHISNISIGLTIFAIGLFKKTVLADGMAQYATPVFDAAEEGQILTFLEAWGGALSYTFQLYFDFSGYSDMAIGIARLFGIKLPVNFHSPYKAVNIVEFWRRWHMTLSRFLKEYLYIPLGGSRHGKAKQHRNLIFTMLLGGLWHGAGWTFVMWGGLHGVYLVINHVWSSVTSHWEVWKQFKPIAKLLSWMLTFTAVVVGWVFFRANSFDAAIQILHGMSGHNGIAIPSAIAIVMASHMGDTWFILESAGITTYIGGGMQFVYTWLWIAVLLPIALFFPNTQQIMLRIEPAINLYKPNEKNEFTVFRTLQNRICWQPNIRWAGIIGLIGAFGVLALTSVSEFLYFQF